MLSYTGSRNLYGDLTNDSSATNLTLGDKLINEAIRLIGAAEDWDFLEASNTLSTTASTQFYDLPFDYKDLLSVTVTIGGTTYSPTEAPSRQFWDKLNSTSVTSDIPEYYFIYNNQLGFYPTPASTTSNAITYNYLRKIVDLNIADYTTGTVDIITNDSASVTGSGTSWTSPMVGRYLRVTHSDTATASGDHQWYKITAVGSTTTLTLDKSYNGTSLTTGASAAYTIAQVPAIPEEYHLLPVYYACSLYYSMKEIDKARADNFKSLFDEGFNQMRQDHTRKGSKVTISDGINSHIMQNPNLFVNSQLS